jgi:hypothetical protein
MNLVESAPFNIGKNKLYEGASGNLIALASKLSFQQGFVAISEHIRNYRAKQRARCSTRRKT